MITNEYGKIENNSRDPRKLVLRFGFIIAAAILLVLLPVLEPHSGSTKTVFAQEQNNNTATLTPITDQGLNSTQVDFASNIEQIRGHLNAAVMNKEAGNITLAKAHTLHPIAEIYSSIEPRISNANITLNETLQQIVPAEIADNSTFRLAVVSDLLSIAGVEYGEAVENGTIKEMVEYQDGQAFVSRAQDVFSQTTPTLPPSLNPEIQEANTFFSDLTGAIQNKSSPEVVDRSIGAIIHEISEITGISDENL